MFISPVILWPVSLLPQLLPSTMVWCFALSQDEISPKHIMLTTFHSNTCSSPSPLSCHPPTCLEWAVDLNRLERDIGSAAIARVQLFHFFHHAEITHISYSMAEAWLKESGRLKIGYNFIGWVHDRNQTRLVAKLIGLLLNFIFLSPVLPSARWLKAFLWNNAMHSHKAHFRYKSICCCCHWCHPVYCAWDGWINSGREVGDSS